MKFKRLTFVIAMSLLGALALPHQGYAQGLTITTFDAPGAGTAAGQGTFAGAISPTGAIAGQYIDASNASHGFLRSPSGTFTTFDGPGAGTNPGQGTIPESINLGGAISGEYLDANNVYHGFLRASDGTFTTFDAPGAGTSSFQGSFGRNINLTGAIAGFYIDASNVLHGFLRAPDATFTTFDAPGAGTGPNQGTRTAGTDGLTDAGAITGTYIDSNFVHHAYVRAPDGTFTTIDAPGAGTGAGQGTASAGINLAGATTGESKDANKVFHGFLRTPDGTITTFDAPGAGTGAGQGTVGENLNALNAITGQYMDSNNVLHGFVRAPDGTITTFDVSGAGASAGQGTFPASNNDAGAITGLYFDASGVAHGFIAVPIAATVIYVSTVFGNQILRVVDSSPPTVSVVYTNTSVNPPFLPEGMVVGPDNKIYVCDSLSNRIWRITQDGLSAAIIYDFSSATAPNNPTGPEGPSFDTMGRLFFNTLFDFRTGAGTPTGIWQITGAASIPDSGPFTPVNDVPLANFSAPTSNYFGRGTSFDLHENLLIDDAGDNEVFVSSPPYAAAAKLIPSPSDSPGVVSTPLAVAVSPGGDIFVLNLGTAAGGNIGRFNSNGVFQNTYATFAAPDFPVNMRFDASGNLFVITSNDIFGVHGKVWRLPPPTPPATTSTPILVVDLSTVFNGGSNSIGLLSDKARGLALPASAVTTPPQPVAPGTSTTFTNGNVINQTVTIPPDANMNGTVTMTVSFIQAAPAVFNATIAGGTNGNAFSGGTPVPAGTTCTPIAGAGGNCIITENKCFDANGVAFALCPITATTTPILLTSSYNTLSPQPNPALLIASDGQSNYAVITTGFNPADPTISGGTKALNSDEVIANLPGSLPVDTAPPTTTAATSPLAPNGTNGWFTTSPVSVILASTDDTLVKQITYSATGAQPIASTTVPGASTFFQIANQGVTTISYQATDQAGNVEAVKTLTVMIDTTPPSISITSPTNGATYTLNQAVAASYTCADPESSPAPSCTGPVASGSNIDTASVGNKVFVVNSTDAAGLSSTQSVSYAVSYNVCILYDPTHAVKSGATIPLKMYLCDANGNDVSNSGVIVQATKLIQVSTQASATISTAGSANPDNDFRFDSTLGPAGGYIFNLQANLATGTYDLFFTAGNDPSTSHFLTFQVN